MFLQIAHSGQNKWWQYILTIVIVIAGAFIGQIPLLVALFIAASLQGMPEADIEEMATNMDFTAVGFDQNLTILFMLLAFVVALGALWLSVKIIHKKKFIHLITPENSLNWKKILFSFWLWMGLTIAAEICFYVADPGNYSLDFQPARFFILLLIAIFVLPLQTSFEELFFRGYLMQGLSLISVYRWVPLLITSVTFGAMHFMNPEVAAFGTGITMVYYIGVGVFLGFLTLMDDSLELALGIHAATNIFGALFVTFDEATLQTAAIFHTSKVNMPWMLSAFFIGALLFTVVVSRKYNWTDWTKWYARIGKPLLEEV